MITMTMTMIALIIRLNELYIRAIIKHMFAVNIDT